MAGLMMTVTDVCNGMGAVEDPPDLTVFAMTEDADPILEFVMGGIGREVLAFSVSGYEDIAMLAGYCQLILASADRVRERAMHLQILRGTG